MRLPLAILFSTLSACTALAVATPPPAKFQLKYFDIRGAAETIRLLLALGDVDYEDVRYAMTPGTMESPSFKAAKTGGELTMNLDRVPVLITPTGEILGQSRAIERYLARRSGLMGSSDVEAAQIDCVAEHCRDVKDAQMRKRFSPFVRDRSEEDKAVDQKKWFEEEMPAMLSKIDRVVRETSKAKGCAVGSTISLADVVIFSLLKDGFPTYQEATLEAAQSCPLLLEIVKAVESNPKVAAWLETRPSSSF